MPIVEIKDAVKTAKDKIKELYEDDRPRELALEEIELIQEGNRELWAVTLGFRRIKSVRAVSTSVSDIFKPPQQVENRVYKTILIDATNGDFVKMEMRLI